jgi:hypothetical protein
LEQLSGLKINFRNSEVLCFRKAKEVEDEYITLGVRMGFSLLDIWEFVFIFANQKMVNGSLLSIVLRENLPVG